METAPDVVPPSKPAPASPTAPSPAIKPQGRKLSLPVLFLALAWVALAACGYLLWTLHQSMPPPSSTGNSADTASGVAAVTLEEKLAELDAKLAELDAKVPELDAKVPELDAKVTKLEAKVTELEGIRTLQRYGNEAITEGNRTAFFRLDEYFKNPEFASLKETAKAEIVRVESYFVSTRRFRGFPGEMPEIREVDPVVGLELILLDGQRHWSLRARAAVMLGEMKGNPQAADALVKAGQTDPNLYVVQEAILAFTRVTGFRSSGVFDSDSVRTWWAANRSEFEKAPEATPATPPTPEPEE
jgi:hypothetical protein